MLLFNLTMFFYDYLFYDLIMFLYCPQLYVTGMADNKGGVGSSTHSESDGNIWISNVHRII